MSCERCNNENAKLLFLSVFNKDNICVYCKEKEEKHKDYYKALIEDREALRNGNYDFEGIGKPEDL